MTAAQQRVPHAAASSAPVEGRGPGPCAAMNADPVVMEFFPRTMTHRESDQLMDRIEAGWELHGSGLWAVELLDTKRCLGFTGLAEPSFEAPFPRAVEVGWRLARGAWGSGYAIEAARVALDQPLATSNWLTWSPLRARSMRGPGR